MSHSLLVGDWLFAPLPSFRPRDYRQFNRLLTEIEEIGLGGALLGNCGSQVRVGWTRYRDPEVVGEDASEGTCDAVGHAKIITSTAAATTNSRLGSSIRRHRLWPAYPLPKPPPRQIPIDRPSNPHRPPVKSP